MTENGQAILITKKCSHDFRYTAFLCFQNGQTFTYKFISLRNEKQLIGLAVSLKLHLDHKLFYLKKNIFDSFFWLGSVKVTTYNGRVDSDGQEIGLNKSNNILFVKVKLLIKRLLLFTTNEVQNKFTYYACSYNPQYNFMFIVHPTKKLTI